MIHRTPLIEIKKTMTDRLPRIDSAVKPWIFGWLAIFSVLHLVGTLPWGAPTQLAWLVAAWLNVVAIFWILYWGTMSKPVTLASTLVLSWLAYLLVWVIDADQWFSWTGVNAQAIRLWFSGGALLLGAAAIWRANRPYVHRMMLIGSVGVIAVQGMHAAIFDYSYQAREALIRREHQVVITHANQKEIFEECRQRGWMCVQGDETDTVPPEFHPNEYTAHTVSLATEFLRHSMTSKDTGTRSWSWHDAWQNQPNARWPVVFTHSRQGNGTQWIVVDAASMVNVVTRHSMYFAWMSTLGGLVWLLGALAVWWFHQRRWKKKAEARKNKHPITKEASNDAFFAQ
jgi:hypothetical protein